MPGQLDFRWAGARVREHVHEAARTTLQELSEDAHAWWLVVVPVETGRLRDSWFSSVQDDPEMVRLVFGAGNPPVEYVLYVELGTGLMWPRGMIRATAGEVVALLPSRFAANLRAA